MLVLFIAVLITVGLSFTCSLLESALYAVPLSYVKYQAESGSVLAKMLLGLKQDIGKPVAAILILNTIANTGGATIVGAQAGTLWGETGLIVASIIFTAVVLCFGEILPKVVGVLYCRRVAFLAVLPLRLFIVVLYPFVWLSGLLATRLSPNDAAPSVSVEEVLSLAAIGTEEGSLHRFEGSVISNVISLDTTLVKDVLTPRTSVFKMSECTTLAVVKEQIAAWNFSRVPIYHEDNPEHLGAYVTQRDIYRNILAGHETLTLKEISREISVVPEVITLDKLLHHMFEQKEHIVSVVDEHGALAGIITLEDVLEELVGQEIVDEYG